MRSLITVGLLLAASVSLLAQAPPSETPLRWIELPSPQLEVNGLPWYGENGGKLFRLPERLKDTYRKPVWDLAQSPGGGRIRFRTDSCALAIRLEYPSPPNMGNMHAFGQTGVDLYVGQVYWGTATADQSAKPGKVYEHRYFDLPNRPRVEREITLYLPLYMPVKILALAVDARAVVRPPRAFALPKPVVFYGTSITQGGCASRPGTAYQAILGRWLNVDFVNLGFSGNGKGEPEVARTVAAIDAAAFVLDFAQNNGSFEALQQVYAPFIETLRARHPQTPILAVTPIQSNLEILDNFPNEGMRELIRNVVSRRIADGDHNLQLVEGTDLLGPSRGDGLVDGTHPNDLGFEWLAEGLLIRLAKVLGLGLDDRQP
jgi:lysophospholipase L1-like esterase